MGRMKDIYFIVDEYLKQGLDEAEIAGKLDVPVDMIEEIVTLIDEYNYHSDMAHDPYS